MTPRKLNKEIDDAIASIPAETALAAALKKAAAEYKEEEE